MAPPSRRDPVALIERLAAEPHRFEFFQAVRLLHCRAAAAPCEKGGAARPVGEDYPPPREVARFRVHPSLGFPAAEIQKLALPPPADVPPDSQPARPPDSWEMAVNFMGLTGPSGVLPRHYTALLVRRVRQRDLALRDFLDLFHHRILSLFYRAWEKYRFPICYERRQRLEDGGDDLFTRCLYSLVGLGTGGLRGRLEFGDEPFLYYGGHFAARMRSAVRLEEILADFFEMPVQIRQFKGQWLYMAPDDQSALPCARWPAGLNCQLGKTALVGERIWDVEARFCVRLGPCSYRQFQTLMPSGSQLLPLCQMIRNFVGAAFDFDVQPVLAAAEVPWCQLGGPGADPARLGWNTWIRSRPFDHDVSDALFSLEGLPWTTSA